MEPNSTLRGVGLLPPKPRNPKPESAAFGELHQVGASLSTEAHLTNRPRSQQPEYRVVAVNKAGLAGRAIPLWPCFSMMFWSLHDWAMNDGSSRNRGIRLQFGC